MSKFVNYKKRDVSLPAGCKDLMDVINPGTKHGGAPYIPGIAVQHSTAGGHEAPVGENETIIGTIADIPKHVKRALDSGSRFFVLVIRSPNHWLAVDFHGLGKHTVSASASFVEEPKPKKIVKAFFRHHGLEVPEDTGMPPQFLPDQPVTLSYSITPQSGDAQTLADLTVELFRHCCPSGENPEIHFHYYW